MDFVTLCKTIEIRSGFNGNLPLKECIKDSGEEFLNQFKEIGYSFKDNNELEIFVQFVNYLKSLGISNDTLSASTDFFKFGYKIPQINKEFDLLRFGKNYNINIELKSNTNPSAQIEQLKKNKYYLNFLGDCNTKYYSISPTINSFIEYDPKTGATTNINFNDFIKVIEEQKYLQLTDEEMDKFFDIKNYLVSPFNDIDKFMNEEYFLTEHQKEIVKNIMNPGENKVFGVKGNPGTGKTLLIYHLYKKLLEDGKNVALIHGADLNPGQEKLKKEGFHIYPVKETSNILKNANNFDYIFFDEGQRLRGTFENSKTQWGQLKETIENSKTIFVISMDSKQILGPKESSERSEKLYNVIKDYKRGNVFSLKDKFRSNKEMSDAIKLILKHPTELSNKVRNKNHNIQLKFFDKREDANNYLEKKKKESDLYKSGKTNCNPSNIWEVLTYTKSSTRYQRKAEGLDQLKSIGENSHAVIGQEFDNVILPMDWNFSYTTKTIENKGEKLVFNYLDNTKSYYPLDKMFYQNITRTREKLQLVIIENFDLFEKLSKLFDEY